ncbi:hypothetical protein ACWECC_05420 [Streptomyces microflavus]|uniref:hypothetical protein n=1 Tax=Streptomyces microflavus TaxID=1919 RepID=UPI0038161DE0
MNLASERGARVPGYGRSAVQVSCAIMAHPRREAEAAVLAARLPELRPVVVLDPDPDGPPSSLRTAAAAWSDVPSWSSHHLVLQDDAVPCADFVAVLEQLLSHHPGLPLSLFTEWGSATATMVRWAALGGGGLVRCVDQYVPTVGLVLPAALAHELGDFARAWPDTQLPDDIAVARFLAERGAASFATAPNLVEHDGDTSLVGNAGPMGLRRSPCLRLAGDPPAPVGILEAPSLVPLISAPRGRAVAMCWDTVHQAHAGYTTLRPELERAGLAHLALTEALDGWLASIPGERLEAALGYGFLHEVWSAAAALAAFMPTTDGKSSGHDLGHRALETMAPGGLRTLVPAIVTDRSLRADLAALVHGGFALRSS